VAWIDRNRDTLDSAVFSTDGRVRSRETVAEDPRTEVAPDIACAESGRFLVVWGDFPSSARNDEVVARAFSRDGSRDGSRFFVNSDTTGDQTDAVVCASGDDGFVVAWRNTVVSGGGSSIHARQLAPSGAVDGSSFVISPLGRRSVAITCGEQRSFVAVTTPDSTGGTDVFAQRVDSDRVLAGDEIVAYRGTVRQPPRITGNADGTFPILWSVGNGVSTAVHGRFFRNADAETTTTLSTTTTTVADAPPTCGDADGSETLTATDVLVILGAAVGGSACEPCRCDTDGSGNVTAQDALLNLLVALGVERDLACPACD
jgi:hypothetical protein